MGLDENFCKKRKNNLLFTIKLVHWLYLIALCALRFCILEDSFALGIFFILL